MLYLKFSTLCLIFVLRVCAQYGHLIPKVSNYSRGCKSLTQTGRSRQASWWSLLSYGSSICRKLVFRERAERKENFLWKFLARSQPAGEQWRKRDYKIRYWRTEGLVREYREPACAAGYRGTIEWVSKHIFAMPLANKLYCVDVPGIGGKNMPLPGGLSVKKTSSGSF